VLPMVEESEVIRLLLSILDPDGVNLRTARRLRRRQYFAKGPNSVWHVDGYDKLKPYGLCISGCIDGFSRQVIWLNVYNTNNNPTVIGGYYMEAVEHLASCPATVRADMGTENGLIEVFQKLLAGDNSFRSGKSSTNQRIECWWAFLRRQCIQYWMDIFEGLKNEGLFSGDFVDKSLIQYCYTAIVEASTTMSISE